MINRGLRCPQFHFVLNTASSGHNFAKRIQSFQNHICTLSDSALRMTYVNPKDLSILYEDEHIIVVDKAANIVSVPGKGSKPFTKFRCDQWQDAIRKAAEGEFDTAESDCQRNLQILANNSSIPRKESRFLAFIAKTLKVVDKVAQQSMWKRICDADTLLNKQPFEDIPNHLVSTADLVEKHCGHKIFVVHRLDMETSGVIIYAKTEESSAELCRQFRDREVRI
jgi:23S rRNA-/tRNA-specific pseudouridylate synthase